MSCRVCLAGVHVKGHGRALAFQDNKDLKDFICERCKYYIDNEVASSDAKEAIRCRFCEDPRGIMIYCQKNNSKKKDYQRWT